MTVVNGLLAWRPSRTEEGVVQRKSFRWSLLVAVIGLATIGAPGALAAPKAKPDLTVMSRNLYLGADIITLATAPDPAAEQIQAQQLHNTVEQTNFPVRAKAIAGEIARTHPDVIGLQEVARYYRGPDGVHDSTNNATTLMYDWLDILQGAIKERHLSYKVVSRQDELDVEVPSAEGFDIRLVLGNAVLVRTGKGARVKVLADRHGVFSSQLSVPLPDQTITLKRGYAGMLGSVAGKRFLFLDPHAEAYSGSIAGQQLTEMLGTVASNRKLPTILAGDFNSDPAATGDSAGAYKAAITAGFVDTGKRASTCCQDEKLDNAVSKLDQWIDHIMVRPKMKVLRSQIVGNKASDRVDGLWPSDHAGVVATVRVR
jgi:endonuclease/exonuclease/phosphatase family metal-dependent hydrolase